MRHDDFQKLVLDFQEYQRNTMLKKNHEYAPGDDKLANFKKAAKMTGKTPEECLWMFCAKHLVSVQDIVNGEAGYTPEILREKAGDISCYLILLEALMMERHT